eukprot:2889026-Prymnesium_polylepis.1
MADARAALCRPSSRRALAPAAPPARLMRARLPRRPPSLPSAQAAASRACGGVRRPPARARHLVRTLALRRRHVPCWPRPGLCENNTKVCDALR